MFGLDVNISLMYLSETPEGFLGDCVSGEDSNTRAEWKNIGEGPVHAGCLGVDGEVENLHGQFGTETHAEVGVAAETLLVGGGTSATPSAAVVAVVVLLFQSALRHSRGSSAEWPKLQTISLSENTKQITHHLLWLKNQIINDAFWETGRSPRQNSVKMTCTHTSGIGWF